MQTLIVSRTRSGSGDVRCIGGIAIADGEAQSVRLLNPDDLGPGLAVTEWGKGFWPPSAPYRVGDLWELELEDPPAVEPPHVEDAIVRGGRKVGGASPSELAEWLQKNVPRFRPPMYWTRGPWEVFDRKLRYSKRDGGKGYAVRGNVPARSTGFWVPDRDLVLDADQGEYAYQARPRHFGISRMKYVGEAEAVPVIRRGTLVRVSLARWYRLGSYPEACWLMLSGWY